MKYYIVAGEASGDLHGSNLMKGLYAQDPGADVRFWGGELMNAVSVSVVDMDDAIFFKTEYKIVRVEINRIMYVESMSEYLKIYLVDEPKPLIVLLSMKKLEERLPVSTFMRVHRSYIINLKLIQEVNKNRIILNRDTYIPIGDNYREAFNNYLNTKFLSK